MNIEEKINKIGQILSDIQADIKYIKQSQERILKKYSFVDRIKELDR